MSQNRPLKAYHSTESIEGWALTNYFSISFFWNFIFLVKPSLKTKLDVTGRIMNLMIWRGRCDEETMFYRYIHVQFTVQKLKACEKGLEKSPLFNNYRQFQR